LIAATGAVGKPSTMQTRHSRVRESPTLERTSSHGILGPSSDIPPRPAGLENTQQIQLAITGMTCASCVGAVERSLLGMKGVVSVSVSLMGKQGAVTYQPEIVTGHDLVQNVQSAGYDAEIIDENVEVQGISDSYSAEADEFLLQLLGAACFALPAFFLSMIAPWTSLEPALDSPFPGIHVCCSSSCRLLIVSLELNCSY